LFFNGCAHRKPLKRFPVHSSGFPVKNCNSEP
jgi:hypothetical protein